MKPKDSTLDFAPIAWARLSALAVLVGSALLILQYLSRQSYWGDEVSILTNISHKRMSDFFHGGLDQSQAAPPLFLVQQKLMWMNFGPGEYSQRFLPMLWGILAMIAFGGLCWRLLPAQPAALVVAIFCFSDKFITHATEVKQYAGDVLVAILLLALAGGAVLDKPDPRRFAGLSLVAAAAVWVSHPVVFIFAAISLVMFICLLQPQQPGAKLAAWISFIAGNLLVLASFAALYELSIRRQRDDAYLREFWRQDFIDWTNPLSIPWWLVSHVWSVCSYVVAPFTPAAILLVAFIGIGAFSWTRRGQWRLGGLCLGPVGFVILAAAIGQYPLSGARVDFFLVPGLLITAGQGLSFLRQIFPAARRWLLLAFALLLIPLLVIDTQAIFSPRLRQNVRPVADYLRNHRHPDEPIYAGPTRAVFLWYWPDAPPPVLDTIPTEPTGAGRFWFVAAERPENLLRDEKSALDLISAHATEIRTDRFVTRGGAAFHFQENAAAP
jgi:hypothetical protein